MTGIRDARLLALTPAMVLLTPTIVPFISTQHRFLYHQDGSALLVLLAVLLNIMLVWLLFVAVLTLADRVWWFGVLFWTAFLACLPHFLLRDWGALAYRAVPHREMRGAQVFACAFVLFVLLAWKALIQPRLNMVISRVAALAGFVSVGWLLTVVQLVSYTVMAPRLDAAPHLHRPTSAPALADGASPRPRVIWVIMDELGYKPVFGDRFPGLKLPAFDALAAQSVNFTDAAAPGLSTEYVIPEIIMGRTVRQVAFTAGGSFDYRSPGDTAWQRLDPEDTVFADALRDRYSTAVDGWFNPYCRLLGPVLDRCFWISRANSFTPDFDVRASFLDNLTGPALHAWRQMNLRKGFIAAADSHEAAMHIEDLNAILQAADQTLADPQATFVFLHLPVPHPGGIYDRSRGVLSTKPDSSYVDNLALADKVLGSLREELVRRGEWDSSAVVVMGDHSWRTTMRWIPTRSWTAEDQAASRGGQFDPRPAYLVKLPGQQTGATINQPYPTVRTRALLDGMMSGRIRTVADLQRWVAAP